MKAACGHRCEFTKTVLMVPLLGNYCHVLKSKLTILSHITVRLTKEFFHNRENFHYNVTEKKTISCNSIGLMAGFFLDNTVSSHPEPKFGDDCQIFSSDSTL